MDLDQHSTIRLAVLEDSTEIQTLIADSVRALATNDYTEEQIEIALRGVWGLDTQLIRDRTYFVAECGGHIVGCGGWSKRATLFGGDGLSDRDDVELDPRIDAARIRAFFVHPRYARHGIGSSILKHCEQAARSCGFRRLELGATLLGERLYRSHGYVAAVPYEYECEPSKYMTIVPMNKDIDDVT